MGCISSTSRTYSPPVGNTPTATPARAAAQQHADPARTQQWNALYRASGQLADEMKDLFKVHRNSETADQLRLRANDLHIAVANREMPLDTFWQEINNIRREAERIRAPDAQTSGDNLDNMDYGSRRFDFSGPLSLDMMANSQLGR